MAKEKVQPAAVTEAHADLFDTFIRKWLPALNLADWRVVRDKRRAPKTLAEVYKIEPEHRLAKYRLGADFGYCTEVTPESLEDTAVHELWHIRLAELLRYVAENGEDEHSMGLEHAVIIVATQICMRLGAAEKLLAQIALDATTETSKMPGSEISGADSGTPPTS